MKDVIESKMSSEDKVKTWDIEGVIILEDGMRVAVKCQREERWGSPSITDIQNDMKNKLVSMVENAPDENIVFSAKKRKKEKIIEKLPLAEDLTDRCVMELCKGVQGCQKISHAI